MNNLKSILLFSAIIAFALKLNAQCSYTPGPSNVTMCSSDGVVIGGTASSCACVVWQPETGLSDPKVSPTRATPSATTTYTVTVLDKDFNVVGEQTITVEVNQNEIIEDFSANPECCFNVGESLNQYNLGITTVPPGLEANIDISPASVWPTILGQTTNNITLSNTCGDETLEKEISISVANENIKSEINIDLVKFVQNVDEAIEKIEKIGSVAKAAGCKSKTEDATTIGDPSGGVKFTEYYKCCKTGTCTGIQAAMEGEIYLSRSVGIDCTFPLPYWRVPYISEFNVIFNFGAGVTASGTGKIECLQGDVCAKIVPKASLTVGVNYELLSGILAKAVFGSTIDISIKGAPTICLNGPSSIGNITPCADVKLHGSIEVFTFATVWSGEYKLIEGCK